MTWQIDPVHSQIEFTVKHMVVATVRGRFNKFNATLDLNEQNPTTSHVEVTIDAASVDTGQEQRDNHLRSPDFFDAQQFPTITYKSRTIEAAGADHYRVLGDLTLHGVTREVPLDVAFEGEVKDMQGKRRAAFSITGALSRKEFGLEWNVALESGGWLVSDKVSLAIALQAVEAVPTPSQVS